MKDLLLLRHAKSDWHSGAATDFERPLNTRGQNSATAVGRWLSTNAPRPDAIVSSPSERTRQTLVRICPLVSFPVSEITWDDRIYGASLETLLDTLGELPDNLGCVMLVGHNPGLEELVRFLARESATLATFDKLFPTAATAHFHLASGWHELRAGSGELVNLVHPRNLMEK